MLLWANNGRRPRAWWAFDRPPGLEFVNYDRQQSTLFDAGLLAEDERAALIKHWRAGRAVLDAGAPMIALRIDDHVETFGV